MGSKGAVGVSDRPEGPFKLLSNYKYDTKVGDDGIFNDAGVLVDDDGKVYIYYGFTESNMNELDPANMYEIKAGSYKRPVIDDTENVPQEQRFEARLAAKDQRKILHDLLALRRQPTCIRDLRLAERPFHIPRIHH